MPEDFQKEFFQDLPSTTFEEERLEQAVSKIKSVEAFIKVNIGKHSVLLLGDHKGELINLKILENWQKELSELGYTVYIGKDYIEATPGCDERIRQDVYLTEASLIVLIEGKGPGTMEESARIRDRKEWCKKTLYFFPYNTYEELINKRG